MTSSLDQLWASRGLEVDFVKMAKVDVISVRISQQREQLEEEDECPFCEGNHNFLHLFFSKEMTKWIRQMIIGPLAQVLTKFSDRIVTNLHEFDI